MREQLTAIIRREDDGYVSLCAELGVASQGGTVAEARANLEEAVAGFLEAASEEEVARRYTDEFYVTRIEAVVG